MELPYETINPFAYEPSIAPHIAAQQAGRAIQIDIIRDDYLRIAGQVEQVIVEGVGGWKVPLNENETVADLAKALDLPVILVVGLRLGCINHALLTAEAIRSDGCELVGWIANTLEDDMPEQSAVIETLEGGLEAPLLGVVPYLTEHSVDDVAAALTLTA
jgi:dethiobiotin synthetase